MCSKLAILPRVSGASGWLWRGAFLLLSAWRLPAVLPCRASNMLSDSVCRGNKRSELPDSKDQLVRLDMIQ